MNDSALTIISRVEGDATIVSPAGDIDLNGAPAFKSQLRTIQSALKPGGRLVIDLSAVPYMDSSGLATIIESMQAARRQSFKLILCGLTPRVRAIFEIAKLHTVFTIKGTLAEALAA